MNHVVIVESKVDALEKYIERYKVFSDEKEALEYARERAQQAGLTMYLPLTENTTLEVGMLYHVEAGDFFVKLIKVGII